MLDDQPSLVILDRDGVINEDSPDFIKSVDEFVPIPGSIEAIAAMSRAGMPVVVASNQSGIGRGLITPEALDRIHARLRADVAAAGGELAGIYFCPHRPDAGCDCRKPKPGLLLRIAEAFDCDLANVPVVGDSRRDLDAAIAAGARAVLVLTGNGEATRRALPPGSDVEVYPDLAAVAEVLTRRGSE